MTQQSHLADVLVRAGAISSAQAETLLNEQSKWGGRLSVLVVEMGFVREEQLVHVLAKELRLPLAPLDRMRAIPSDALSVLAATTCERMLVLPLGVDNANGRMQLAISDPTDEGVLGELRMSTGLEIDPYVSTTTVIRRAIRINFYGENTAEVLRVIPEIKNESGRHKVGSSSGSRALVNAPTNAKVKTGSRPPMFQMAGHHPPQAGRPTPIPLGQRTPRPPSSGGHPVIKPSDREGPFRQGWMPSSPGASHPASLELDAATEAAARMADSPSSVPKMPVFAQQQAQLSSALQEAERKLQATEQSMQAMEQTLQSTEQQLAELQSELQHQKRQFQLQNQQLQSEIDDLQQLLRNRFQEHRLLMKGLFDLLVARGYLNKDEIVSMLSQVAQNEPS